MPKRLGGLLAAVAAALVLLAQLAHSFLQDLLVVCAALVTVTGAAGALFRKKSLRLYERLDTTV